MTTNLLVVGVGPHTRLNHLPALAAGQETGLVGTVTGIDLPAVAHQPVAYGPPSRPRLLPVIGVEPFPASRASLPVAVRAALDEVVVECATLLSSVLAGERSQWSCREISSDTMILITSHHFADGDTIELMVQIIGDEVIVSDGGEVLARLDSVGVNVEKRGRIGDTWTRLLAAHALEYDHGLLLRRANIEHVAELVQEMADAVANIDGLRLLASSCSMTARPSGDPK